MNMGLAAGSGFTGLAGALPDWRRSRGASRFWWAVIAFWVAVSFAAGLELAILPSVSTGEALEQILWRLIPWLFMTVLIIPISSAYTLDRAGWRRAIWVYLLACAASLGVVALCTYLGPPPAVLLGHPARTDAATFSGNTLSVTFFLLTRATYQLPTFWGLVAVAHTMRFYEREDEHRLREVELRAQLSQARLQALQLQLNPHFLFNILNSIAALVPDNPAAAEQMIEALADLLRAATSITRHQVTVREEIHFLDQYLLLEHIRFGERLQPLVENAIKHGVETQLGGSSIEIAVQTAGGGNFLRLEVSNSGPVAPPGRQIAERVGLSNTRARLHAMFGPQASLELHARKEGGFVARVLIPRSAAARPPGVEFQTAL